MKFIWCNQYAIRLNVGQRKKWLNLELHICMRAIQKEEEQMFKDIVFVQITSNINYTNGYKRLG